MRNRKVLYLGIAVFGLVGCSAQESGQTPSPQQIEEVSKTGVYTKDIEHFWEAYDAIRATSDREEQLVLLNDLYIDRGSPGLHAMIRARSYTSQEYLRGAEFSQPVSEALKEMKAIYPEGKDVPVYFVIGALRASGTANDNKLLIGAELALANPNTPSHELSERLSHLGSYFANNPSAGFIGLNLHEYVHTQQRSISGNSLLSQALLEGVAEYVSTAAIGRQSTNEAIIYGKAHNQKVIDAFEQVILSKDYSEWIWNSPENEFGTRDLGYYVGYVIAESYVAQNANKNMAIKTLIELDYQDSEAVNAIVDRSGIFPKPISAY